MTGGGRAEQERPPRVMSVLTCLRYPVKSLGGEELRALEVDARGVVGDREWAVRTARGQVASGKRTRRYVRLPHLLDMHAATTPAGVLVTLPDGRRLRVDDPALPAGVGAVVGQPVSLATESDTPHRDAEPLHLVTTASLRWWAGRVPEERADRRRLRPNVVVDVAPVDGPAVDGPVVDGPVVDGTAEGRLEDGWVGRSLRIGDVRLHVVEGTERCAMVSADQCGLGRGSRLLRALAGHQMTLGVYARVLTPGTIRAGDPVTVE